MLGPPRCFRQSPWRRARGSPGLLCSPSVARLHTDGPHRGDPCAGRGLRCIGAMMTKSVRFCTPHFPLMRARVPGYRGETLAMVSKPGRLEYLPSAGRQRVGTRGEVRCVVGTDGRAVAAYTQVTRAGWRDFIQPMRKAIVGTEFIPATSGGCKVPALARQRFSFVIPRSSRLDTRRGRTTARSVSAPQLQTGQIEAGNGVGNSSRTATSSPRASSSRTRFSVASVRPTPAVARRTSCAARHRHRTSGSESREAAAHASQIQRGGVA